MYQFTFEPVHFSDVVMAADLNKNFGGSTDLAKKKAPNGGFAYSYSLP